MFGLWSIQDLSLSFEGICSTKACPYYIKSETGNHGALARPEKNRDTNSIPCPNILAVDVSRDGIIHSAEVTRKSRRLLNKDLMISFLITIKRWWFLLLYPDVLLGTGMEMVLGPRIREEWKILSL
jgi:hypothetical protein